MGLWYHICKNAFILKTNFYSTHAYTSSNVSIIINFSIWVAVSYHIGTVIQNIIIYWSKCKSQTTRHRWLRKTQAAKVYSSIVPCDFKYVFDMQLPTTSHNLPRGGYFLLSKKRNTVKYFCFLAERGLSVALLGFFGATNCLQLGRLFEATICLQLKELSWAAIHLWLEKTRVWSINRKDWILLVAI